MVPVRREVDVEPGAADRPRDEAGDAQVAPRRDDQQREPERAERAARPARRRAHATTTAHFAECVPAVT